MISFRLVLAILLSWNAVLWSVIGVLYATMIPGGWVSVLVLAVLLLLPLIPLATGIAGRGYPSPAVRLWLYRPFWYTQLFLPLLASAGVLGLVAGLPFGAALTVGRWSAGAMGVVLCVAALWGYAGSRRLRVRPLELPFPTLPAALDGLRIVQLSDLHVGPHTSRRHLARIVQSVRAAEPHLIVHTGDQVDDYARDVEPLGAAFAELSAPLGVIAIAGNHDVFAGWGAVRRGMERLGWRVLVNEAVQIEHNGAVFWVAATGDPAGRGPLNADVAVAPDIERTLARVGGDAFTLALAHNPALWPALAARGVALTLSGHTHYGQFAIPALRWCLASPFLEFAMGRYQRGDATLYINPGTNFWGIPFRIGTPPEVTVITLRRGSGYSTAA